MLGGVSRRGFLAGGLSAVAGAALAEAPLSSLRPVPRPDLIGGAAPAITRLASPSVPDLIAEARLGGRIGFVVADARTGVFLETREPDLALPAASVTKAVTAIYGLSTLGENHRFRTRFIATGPVEDGVIEGDLVLAGAGDPVFDTDAMAAMVAELKARGVRGVRGRFLVAAGALPYVRSIDPTQPDHVGYSPAISGLNLNYNRVHFQWERAESGWSVNLDARSASLRPPVTVARMAVAARDVPIYTYSDAGGVDDWTVASEALGNAGSRWLPVRRPDLYAGEVCQVIAASQGIELPDAEPIEDIPAGRVLVAHTSESLSEIIRGMMRYSTNLTAEVIGLSASARRGVGAADLRSSASAMSAWMRDEFGARSADFVDHSGLGDASQLSAADMARFLVRLGPGGPLHRLMREIVPQNASGAADPGALHRIHAKTGTLNFVSTLAGYVTADNGVPLVFAIFTGDTIRRADISPEDMERAPGARAWAQRSRWLQHQLINRWAGLYGV
ncbi:D-alanyl-D-alanine carboxypeptidase/D-alanyl-D-alanine endopeptidase [Sinisalibacter lacisalsi]|uniref:D-alanyl-D-alanine carboxypeptidase n=1 Tax=Sinisalibacter lacisalsi TaxID=1526570 RepID=A0ABQ1QWH8_9RHOB|nr:D-alanyl-D-alanine carboxypeptidase/D-alanyl-D-alanine-endopeptidase [Sinisalibacter lacisalsi]GGD47394.1 D-alanyl-D-alanine carboxypeptidase [Sinisalibacter lacisalsi]